jgi:predicted dehydrogenase
MRSTQASIDYHELPSTVKAYGSPEDLAKDPDVDLVVVAVQVAKHYKVTMPALLAGKDTFVEWPLGATTAQAEELTAIAVSKGLKTFVGCQARADPLVVKVRELVQGGKIGKVLSSTSTGALVGLPKKWPAGAAYYQDINSGGNVFTIYVGHCKYISLRVANLLTFK